MVKRLKNDIFYTHYLYLDSQYFINLIENGIIKENKIDEHTFELIKPEEIEYKPIEVNIKMMGYTKELLEYLISKVLIIHNKLVFYIINEDTLICNRLKIDNLDINELIKKYNFNETIINSINDNLNEYFKENNL